MSRLKSLLRDGLRKRFQVPINYWINAAPWRLDGERKHWLQY